MNTKEIAEEALAVAMECTRALRAFSDATAVLNTWETVGREAGASPEQSLEARAAMNAELKKLISEAIRQAEQVTCVECGAPVYQGNTRCERHLRLNRQAGKRLYNRRGTNGICRDCGNPAAPGKKRCQLHLRLHREADKRYRDRKKARK